MAVRENQLLKVALWPHVLTYMYPHAYAHKQISATQNLKMKKAVSMWCPQPDLTVGNPVHCFIFPLTLADTVKAALLTMQ